MTMPDPMRVLAVCGVGMGSSLILAMTVETALNRMGVSAEVSNTDISSARSEAPDVIVGQSMHVSELEGVAPVLVTVDDFVDDVAVEEKLRAAFQRAGWQA